MRRSSLLVTLAGLACLAGEARSEGMAHRPADPSKRQANSKARSLPSPAPFVPMATCCEPTALGVVRNNRPLVKWVLAEEPIGETRAVNAPAPPATFAPATLSPAPAVAIVAAAATVPMDVNIENALTEWSETSRSLEPMSPARTQRLTRSLQQDYSGHEIAWITLFTGPVELEDLRDDLTWTGLRSTSDGITLTAVPRDATERLFVSQLEVTLTENHVPKSITFVDRQGNRREESVAFEQIRIQPGRSIAPRVVQVAAMKIPGDPAVVHSAEFTRDSILNNTVPPAESHEVTEAISDQDIEAGDTLLQKWSAATARLSVREIQYHEFRYDLASRTDSHRIGRVLVSRDGSVKSLPTGTPHKDAAPRPEILLPMASARSVDDFRRQYGVTVVKNDDRKIHLKLTPVREEDLKQAKTIEVLLSPDTMLPIAVRSVSTSGSVETVWSITRTVPREDSDAP